MQEQQHPFLLHDTERRRYESWDRMNYAWRAQKTAQNYRALHDEASRSPIRSPNPSPPRSPIQHHHRHNNHYRSLSPASRTQAIARGQRELMEMVKNMPEACYELSLKDLVEHNHRTGHNNNISNHDHRGGEADEDDEEEEEQEEERNDLSSKTNLLARRAEIGEKNKKRTDLNDVVLRGGRVGSNGTGSGQDHLLKMVFPVPFGPKRKKKKKLAAVKSLGGGNSKNDDTNSNCSTTVLISPKTSSGYRNSNNHNNSGGGGGVDKEWWKKRYSVAAAEGGDRLSSSSNSGGSKSSSTSGSRSSSLTSRSSSNNARHGNSVGCWWFLGVKKSRDVE